MKWEKSNGLSKFSIRKCLLKLEVMMENRTWRVVFLTEFMAHKHNIHISAKAKTVCM